MSETVADIVREMREHASGSSEAAWYTPADWTRLCNRLESAMYVDHGELRKLFTRCNACYMSTQDLEHVKHLNALLCKEYYELYEEYMRLKKLKGDEA